jgi:hypothetical protein
MTRGDTARSRTAPAVEWPAGRTKNRAQPLIQIIIQATRRPIVTLAPGLNRNGLHHAHRRRRRHDSLWGPPTSTIVWNGIPGFLLLRLQDFDERYM